MFKFIKWLLLLLLVAVIGIVIFAFSFVNSIQYSVTANDLPQDVYTTDGDLLSYAKTKIVSLVTASTDDRYTITEEFLNLIIWDSIKENVNADYDPLGTCSEPDSTACQTIVSEDYYYINYAFAKLNEDSQMVITISGGIDKIIHKETALIMVFDIDFRLTDMEVVFTLNSYSLGERELSKSLLDRLFRYVGKSDVENSVSFGTLDLTDYTFTISITDAMS